jgi:hypothetical protein
MLQFCVFTWRSSLYLNNYTINFYPYWIETYVEKHYKIDNTLLNISRDFPWMIQD